MTTAGFGARSIAVGVDGSEPALQAVRWAAAEAGRRDASLILINAVDVTRLYSDASVTPFLDDVRQSLETEATDVLRGARDAARQVADVETDTRWVLESPVIALRAASRSVGMLVLGSAGRGALGTALGSVLVAVSSHAECPVVVVRGTSSGDRPVLVGVDGGPLSGSALAHGFGEAAMRGVPLVAVHVWSDADTQRAHLGRLFELTPWERMRDAEERALAERLAGWSARYPGTAVERVVERDGPARALVRHSSDADLVVVATRGRGGFTGLLLGSTGLALIQRADCPVMLVGPEARPEP